MKAARSGRASRVAHVVRAMPFESGVGFDSWRLRSASGDGVDSAERAIAFVAERSLNLGAGGRLSRRRSDDRS
jgi:hypothetical protein